MGIFHQTLYQSGYLDSLDSISYETGETLHCDAQSTNRAELIECTTECGGYIPRKHDTIREHKGFSNQVTERCVVQMSIDNDMHTALFRVLSFFPQG